VKNKKPFFLLFSKFWCTTKFELKKKADTDFNHWVAAHTDEYKRLWYMSDTDKHLDSANVLELVNFQIKCSQKTFDHFVLNL
jgi:hypothetical protein